MEEMKQLLSKAVEVDIEEYKAKKQEITIKEELPTYTGPNIIIPKPLGETKEVEIHTDCVIQTDLISNNVRLEVQENKSVKPELLVPLPEKVDYSKKIVPKETLSVEVLQEKDIKKLCVTSNIVGVLGFIAALTTGFNVVSMGASLVAAGLGMKGLIKGVWYKKKGVIQEVKTPIGLFSGIVGVLLAIF